MGSLVSLPFCRFTTVFKKRNFPYYTHPDLLSLFNTLSNIKLFESKKVSTHWNAEKEQWFFSMTGMIEILTESPGPRKYWNALKTKLSAKVSELFSKLRQLKMLAPIWRKYVWRMP